MHGYVCACMPASKLTISFFSHLDLLDLQVVATTQPSSGKKERERGELSKTMIIRQTYTTAVSNPILAYEEEEDEDDSRIELSR